MRKVHSPLLKLRRLDIPFLSYIESWKLVFLVWCIFMYRAISQDNNFYPTSTVIRRKKFVKHVVATTWTHLCYSDKSDFLAVKKLYVAKQNRVVKFL